MFRTKLSAVALVLALAGAVYAAGRTQDAAHQNHSAHAAGHKAACCQAKHKQDGQKADAMSCDREGGCCHAHKADAKQTAATQDGESCCAGGGCCGGSGGCCAGHKKEGAQAAVVKTSAEQTSAGQQAASCCDGGSCCKEGADCCKGQHQAAAQTATADHKHEGCCACCADSCPVDAGR